MVCVMIQDKERSAEMRPLLKTVEVLLVNQAFQFTPARLTLAKVHVQCSMPSDGLDLKQ